MKKNSNKIFRSLILIFMSIFFIDNVMAYGSMVTDVAKDCVGGTCCKNNICENPNGIAYEIWSLKTTTIDGVAKPRHLFCLDPGLEMISEATYTASGSFTNTSYACGIINAYKDDKILTFGSLSGPNYAKVQEKIWDSEGKTCDNEISTEPLTAGTISIDATNTELSLSNDEKYFVSGKISVTTSGLLGPYSVELSGAPDGAGVYTSPDSTISVSQTNSTTLYIKVPVSSVNSSSSFTLTLSGKYNKTKHTYLNATLFVFNYSSGGINKPDQEDQRLAFVETSTSSSTDEGTVAASKDFSIKTGTLSILKLNSNTNLPVEGATFELYDNKGNLAKHANGSLVGTLTTDSNGKITVSNLIYGTYKLVEKAPAEGYLDEPIEVNIVVNESTRVMEIKNNPIQTIISKKDIANEKEIEGATIEIRDEEGNVIHSFISGADPYEFYLGPGKYTLVETIAPEGYEEIKTSFDFEILDNGDVKLLGDENDYFKTDANAITLYNKVKAVEVPDTGKVTVIYTVIGCLLLVAGGVIIYLTLRNKKNK